MNSIGVCTFVMYVIGEYFLNSLYSDIDSFAAALVRKGLRRAL